MKTIMTIFILLTVVFFSTAQTQGTLSVSTLTSQTTGGTYAPANVMSVWVSNSSGTFVKSLLVYASARQQYLYTWIAADPSLNEVDAITGATQISHGTRACSWNGKNVNEIVVPDGTYTVTMELTDKHAQGNLGTFNFIKGPNSQTQTLANVPSFANISIKWTPISTGLENVLLNNLYNVYPNPTNSTIYISGFDVKEVDIYSITGSRILTSKIQNINLSSLPKGVYLVVVNANAGTVVKKIEKN
jgi:hypothetical protein